jgi:hypothetical protein
MNSPPTGHLREATRMITAATCALALLRMSRAPLSFSRQMTSSGVKSRRGLLLPAAYAADGAPRSRHTDSISGDTPTPWKSKETPLPASASLAPAAVVLSSDSRTTAGILLLTILAVEYGGLTVLRIVRGRQPATGFQRAFARAGHAHAGIFVIFALVAQILADAAHLHGAVGILARDGIWVAAILFPAGFFLSSAGRGVTQPNRFIVLLYLGAATLTAGVLALGIGLVAA